MVISRKDKPSFIGKNLLFLRKQKGKTLEDMADYLSLKGKSSFRAYEEDRALPDIHKIMKLASYFDVSVEELVYQDIENAKGKKKDDAVRLFEIEKVPISAAAGYAKGFDDTGYIKKLKKISIPFKPYGITRAFSIAGDSMEPDIPNGSDVVGVKISSSEIKDKKAYIVITDEGVQCKNIRLDKDGEVLYLISSNQEYPPTHYATSDIREIWEVWKILKK